MGHFGLRMFRQYGNADFKSSIWVDLAKNASILNKANAAIPTVDQVTDYVNIVNQGFTDTDPVRAKLRLKTLTEMPEYLLIGNRLLEAMARLNQYGLKSTVDENLRRIIRSQSFESYVSDPDMIRAWAAQLANQVYYLRQLGEQDVVNSFISEFKTVYPDANDKNISNQQYSNKIYGMTHLIFSASEYYQKNVNETDFKWIYDYFRKNIDTILARTKADVIAEVGISFLLANKEKDPVVIKAKQYIYNAIDKKRNMIPSVNGNFELAYGEHRNVLAIMLLDWGGANSRPTYQSNSAIFANLPYGIEPK